MENALERISFDSTTKVLEMLLSNSNDQLDLTLKVLVEGQVRTIEFYNVSRLRMEDVSTPFEVYGFEIVCHSRYGWEKESKYEMRDYEDNRISFFCEDFKIDEE